MDAPRGLHFVDFNFMDLGQLLSRHLVHYALHVMQNVMRQVQHLLRYMQEVLHVVR
jgi:hypothetical protein